MCLGVRGGPLFDTTRAWFNFLRVIVSIMKRGYDEPQDVVEEDGYVFVNISEPNIVDSNSK